VPDDIETPSSSSRLLEEVAIADGERKNLLKGNGRVHASVGQGSKEVIMQPHRNHSISLACSGCRDQAPADT
jgi:hypothetical protein